MSGISVQQAIAKVDAYREAIIKETRRRCVIFIDNLLEAAIEYRLQQGHNFTGNLINSIAVGLYQERKLTEIRYASDELKSAIQVKMTYPKRYAFTRDWDGDASHYIPAIATNEGWGKDDARTFISGYRPGGKNLFDIVVAYTTEYASFVEKQRSSTGILSLYAEAPSIAMLCLELGKSN